jgi:3',5'-cyclic AMP phosphodiesterase CpdA
MRILWITDLHLNFLKATGASQAFGAYSGVEQEFDAIVITGDIAEAPTTRRLLNEFAKGAGFPVFFVLGNHDYYFGSIAGVESEMAEGLEPNLHWLDALTEPVLLDDETALVGQTGWYDGLLGNAMESRVLMSDFELIADFKPHFRERAWADHGDREDLLEKLRTLSKQHADALKPRLLVALKLRKNVIVATHYPPFAGACWHDGAISNTHWMPWFTSANMGAMLADVAAEHPDQRILVLCGHTHSEGFYEHLPNLYVLTGKALYGAPDVAGFVETPLKMWDRPERCDRCDAADFRSDATIMECKLCNRVIERVTGIWTIDLKS